MEYVVIDRRKHEEFEEKYDSREKAIEAAKIAWGYLTHSEKEKVEAFFVKDEKDEIVADFKPSKQEFIEKLKHSLENDSENVWITDPDTGRQGNIDIYLVMHGEEEKEPFEASAILETDLTHEAWDDLYQSFLFD